MCAKYIKPKINLLATKTKDKISADDPLSNLETSSSTGGRGGIVLPDDNW